LKLKFSKCVYTFSRTIFAGAIAMRISIKTPVAILALAASAAVAYAQTTQDQPQGPRPHGQFQHRGPMNPDFEIKMLTRRLSLTPDQVTQIQPILADRQERMKALKPAEGTQPDFKAMHEQRKAIMTDSEQKLESVLTPEQKEKLHSHEFHGGPGGPRGNWQHQPTTTPAPAL
jgi:Spy/CpxP family protein refolding chaperone